MLSVATTPQRASWATPVFAQDVAWPRRGARSFGFLRRRADGTKRRHNGVDLFAPLGTPVLAVDDGVVVHAAREYVPGFSHYGRTVVLKTASGPYVLYSHLDSVDVERGQQVRRASRIGTVGDTAFTRAEPDRRFQRSAPHLHLEVSPRPYPQSSTAARIDPTALYFDVTPRYTQGGKLHTVRRKRTDARWVIALAAGVALYYSSRR